MHDQDYRRYQRYPGGTQPGQNRQPPGQSQMRPSGDMPRGQYGQGGQSGSYGRGQDAYSQDRYTDQDRYNSSERYGPPADRYAGPEDRYPPQHRYEQGSYDQGRYEHGGDERGGRYEQQRGRYEQGGQYDQHGGRYDPERYDQRQRYPSDRGQPEQRFDAAGSTNPSGGGDYWMEGSSASWGSQPQGYGRADREHSWTPRWSHSRGGREQGPSQSGGQYGRPSAEQFARYGSQSGSQQGFRGQGQGQQSAQSSGARPSYYGRGPKNYQRSDERIREDIHERLNNDAYIDSQNVGIEVEDGRVVMSGTVQDRQTKHAIENLVDNVFGVKDIENNIRVERAGSPLSQAEGQPS